MIIIDGFEVPYYPRPKQGEMEWFLMDEQTENDDFIYSIFMMAEKVFDMEKVWGYEIWEKVNVSTHLHLDKDEKLYERRGVLSYPICSVIYYYDVEDLVGGELVSPGNWSIIPKQNRLVIFGPAVPHQVLDFTGTRKSVLVNFWQERLGTIPKNIP